MFKILVIPTQGNNLKQRRDPYVKHEDGDVLWHYYIANPNDLCKIKPVIPDTESSSAQALIRNQIQDDRINVHNTFGLTIFYNYRFGVLLNQQSL